MGAPYTYDDAVRIHDMAIYNWLGRLLVHYPEIENPVDPSNKIAEKKNHPVIRVKASPDRAYASIVDTLIAENWIPEAAGQVLRDKAADDLSVLPLPAFSWQRSDPRPDPELANVPFIFRKAIYNCTTGKWEFWRWPKHWLTDYTITFWANREFSKAFFIEWIASEFGNLGAGIRETFIPVIHKDPFGPITSRLQLTGDLQDLSELEGEEARYVRSEFTVTLRTWITMPAVAEDDIPGVVGECGDDVAGVGDGVGVPIYYIQKSFNVCGDVFDIPASLFQSLNLFPGVTPIPASKVCTLWPKEGDAEIETSDNKQSFDLTLTDADDKVTMFGLTVPLEGGYGIVGFSFDYVSDAPVTFQFIQQDTTTDPFGAVTTADSFVLPAAPQGGKFHHYMLTNRNTVHGKFVGIGPTDPQHINLSNLDLRVITPLQPVVIPTQVVGADRRFEFNGLQGVPHLVIMKLTDTPAGPVTVTLENDIATPTFIRSRLIDKTKNEAGFIMMNQPEGSTLALVVPLSVTFSQVYAQPFRGYFNGSTV